MAPWTEVVGDAPAYLLEPSTSLPDAATVLERVRGGAHTKVVALVGYHDDAEAGMIARSLPYGHRGAGIEEIVFVRTGPATEEVVQFEDDDWPGEDRTFVMDDLDAALEMAVRFAVEDEPAGSAVLITGRPRFVRDIADKLDRC